ncbi:MAG: hypothetical protein QGG76_06405, partial [Candidatus Thalassarchaeaceae archaeon]|nr:hypothetical protein [Candidatus Thalassarchaeaceae archaeon]
MEDKATTWEIAVLRLGMPLRRYLLYFTLPATLAGLVAGLTVWLATGSALSTISGLALILLFTLMGFSITIIYPITQVSAEA